MDTIEEGDRSQVWENDGQSCYTGQHIKRYTHVYYFSVIFTIFLFKYLNILVKKIEVLTFPGIYFKMVFKFWHREN